MAAGATGTVSSDETEDVTEAGFSYEEQLLTVDEHFEPRRDETGARTRSGRL